MKRFLLTALFAFPLGYAATESNEHIRIAVLVMPLIIGIGALDKINNQYNK